MSVELRAPASRPQGADGAPLGARRPRGGDLRLFGAVLVAALALALLGHAHHGRPIPGLLAGGAASLALALVCGDALAVGLAPRAFRPLAPILSLALGMAASGLALTVLGLAHIPLAVSLWVVLAVGLAASLLVRRRERRRERRRGAAASAPARGREPAAIAGDRGIAARLRSHPASIWIAVLAVLFWVAVIPAGRLAQDTVFGTNPDASQVVGIAVLFQHAPPTATDYSQPLNAVPPAWRFRYPIFYPLAAASNLAHLDPIAVFAALSALLVVIACFGYGLMAVELFDAPGGAGPAIAAAFGFSWVALHLAWHPYYNQLWGYALVPYALLFGWRAIDASDRRAALLCAFALVSLWLAYPLALPYPLVILAALALARWRRPRMPAISSARDWALVAVGLVVLAPAVAGAALKLGEGISQVIVPNSHLWGGDVTSFMPFGRFVGTGGGILPALAVAAVAVWGLAALDRRRRIALGVVLGALCLLDLRFRLTASGTYMDFKHLAFVGPLVMALAGAQVARLALSRARAAVAAGSALALAWTGAALALDRTEALGTGAQVTPQMLQIRSWAARLPRNASVRVDIPPSGVQLWAVFLLGSHPVDSPTPVLGTTYAHAPFGGRANYSLALRYRFAPGPPVALAPAPFTVGPPVFENSEFVVRRIRWPARYDYIPRTASRHLVPSG